MKIIYLEDMETLCYPHEDLLIFYIFSGKVI